LKFFTALPNKFFSYLNHQVLKVFLKTPLLKTENHGTIVRAIGVFVDVEFQTGGVHSIHDALQINRNDRTPHILEVQKHVNVNTARIIAMNSTEGFQRGLVFDDRGGPNKISIGKETLVRMFTVLGKPIDIQGPLPDNLEQHPNHATSPKLHYLKCRQDALYHHQHLFH
jgi:F-type H+-transporting ATPase subunit beta